ncbi:MAG TPA: hypothetical protein VK636_10580 [Gemmatimonadaceae bacterium]|nr:hypothetical protein [Gemmatimonadaceae bacterium]
MHITHVQYSVKPEYADKNRSNIARVMADLRRMMPEGLRYSTFIKADGKTFIHFAMATDEGNAILRDLPSFQTFQTELKASGPEVAPDASKLTLVDSSFDLNAFVTGT